MTNQMKKILMVCLILSYANFLGLSIVLIASGFVYKYVFNYVFLAVSAALCAYFQYLESLIVKQDKELAEQIFYAKKLLELREAAKLRFYKSRGLTPQYNEDGTVMEPDKFIGILTKLDEEGKLEKSIYEILGVEPVFDKNGKEVPAILVLKHLMKKPRTSKFEEIKGLSMKMIAKGTQNTAKKEEKKKEEKKVAQSVPSKDAKKKAEQAVVYAKYYKEEKKLKKAGEKSAEKKTQRQEKVENPRRREEQVESTAGNSQRENHVNEYIIDKTSLNGKGGSSEQYYDPAVLE